MLKGQDYSYYTQYMFNGLSINPAYAGSQDFINITGDIREQWVGIKGAPSTQTLSAHSPVFHDQVGLGIVLINDKVGVTNQQEFSMNYSYRLRIISQNLSLGLKLGMNTLSYKFNELTLEERADANFQNNANTILPIFGLGAYWKSNNYYAGLSIPQLYKFFSTKNVSPDSKIQKLMLLTGGYIFSLNEDFKLKPSFLAKANFGSVFEMDLSSCIFYKDDYILGLSYKSLNSLSIYFEIGFNKKYYIGYSYDMATTRLISQQAGTHEISFNIYIDRKGKTKVMNPRYF
jgi:type IX secretion system PorP/SprF family membrane protein